MVHLTKMLLQIMLCMSLVNMTLQNVITIVQGRIRGIQNDGYTSYVGIPYASVAGNAGRFKGPGLAPVWNGIRESRDPLCSSTSAVEDCLQLDVHVPDSGFQMPVLFWVKGGNGDYHTGKLVAQGIIVVIVRHRLGPFGFLCSKADNIPGNTGVKDVLQALRWVRDNIVAFNGNPHNVIIAGQSFGAAMVEALMLLPSACGLYHGAILQSGSILCPWAFNYDAEDRGNALRKMMNTTEEGTPLMKSDTVTLGVYAEEIDVSYLPFGMCVEKTYKNGDGLILETPFSLLSKGKIMAVPVLMGYNTNEAYIFTSILRQARVTGRMARDMMFLLPEEFQYLTKRELNQIMKQINDTYFHENINMAAVLSYHRDAYFLSHIHQSMRFHSTTHQPVYYYQFSYSGNVGVQAEGIKKTGAAHSDELAYLFPQKGRDYDDDDGLVQQHLLQLWANFVKHLNPTPGGNSQIKWESTGPHHPQILDINTKLEMMEFPHTEAMQMWEDTYEKYYHTRNLNRAQGRHSFT